MRGFAIACGFLMAAVGIVGIVDPLLLLDATSFTLTSLGLYIAAAFRVVFGLVGVERARGIVAWWVGQGNAFMRIWALIAVIFGLFVIYAVIPRRRSASL